MFFSLKVFQALARTIGMKSAKYRRIP